MFKKGVAVTYFPIGRFISTTDGSEVTTGTPTGAYSKDGTEGTLSGTIAYKSTAKEWGITGLTATEMNGDVIGLNFTLAGAVPIHYTIRTTTKLVSDLADAPAVATDGSLQVTLKSGTHTGAVIPTVTNVGTLTTNNDKTGYTASTVSDKTGYSLSSTQTFNLTGNITGNLSGSVGSVTGAVGSVTGNVGGNVAGSVASVTGAVGSVTGNVGGNVTGSVGSVAAGGIASTSFATDAISSAAVSAAAVTKIQAGLSTYAGGDTSGTTTLLSRLTSQRAGYLDNLSTAPPTAAAVATAVWTTTTASDFATASSPGKILVTQLGGTFTTTSSSVFSTASLANAPSGGGGSGLSLAELQDELDSRYLTTQIVAGIAAVSCGNFSENADHTTTSFADVLTGTARVTSTNTPTSRTVTVL